MKLNLKKIKPSHVVFALCLLACFVMTVFSIVDLFSFKSNSGGNFNIFLPTILICAILLLTLFASIEKYSGLVFSQTQSIFFMICILTFVAIFPTTGFFNSRAAFVILFLVAGVALTIVSLSICFACVKNQFGSATVKPLFFVVFLSALSLAFGLIFEICVFSLSLMFSSSSSWTLFVFLKNLFWSSLSSGLFIVFLTFSVLRRKKLVNFCLIQKVQKTTVKPKEKKSLTK